MKIKKIVTSLIIAATSAITLISCGSEKDNSTKISQNTSTENSKGNVTEGSKASTNGDDKPSSTMNGGNSSNASSESESKKPFNPGTEESFTYEPYDRSKHKVYMVGDSTMCNYEPLDTYFYPRYGYGTQMDKYFDTTYLTFENLAMSGRSSISFLSETNYTTLKNGISEGDYLIIGWGHNDEKEGTNTFRNAKYPSITDALADSESFQYSLYENYIKLAQEKGANPILATPIVRANNSNNYKGSSAHITSTGDYRQAVIDVANYYNIPYVDLTSLTKYEYEGRGYNEAIKFHAIKAGTDDSEGMEPNWYSVDTTHINYYGANYISYLFSRAIRNTDSTLKYYVRPDTTRPTEDILERYSGYKWIPYTAPDFTKYNPGSNFEVLIDDWYGLAYGDLGGEATAAGYKAYQPKRKQFVVGQSDATGSTLYKGKIDSSVEGCAFALRRLASNHNFTLTAHATITTYQGDDTQGGFGLTVRDACWINQNNSALLSNSINAGVVSYKGGIYTNYSRSVAGIEYGKKLAGTTLSTDFEATFNLQRKNQNYYATTTINGVTYENEYIDFDLYGKDKDYIYVGFYGARGVVATFDTFAFTDDGENQGA